ncbi:SAM-dependent methyltransferase [Actinoalloteichus sp. AHMU CJ021]|uniref:class I SAM-dependent methyltransferase n=1 Tax=Actinoalloteichus TaxID=65496 RepID=UPI000CA012EB|nr:SAM-dependent methyltransferase [Actinoalloteichus sp. AHMU CJ021]
MTSTQQPGTGVESGVGLTAFMVAAARAMETHRTDSLASDPYAEHFVRAAPACADWPLRIEHAPGGDANPLWGRLGRYFGLRTRVLDDFVARALGSGTRQAVLLGAGLDSRAFRLDWPTGCVVFELDQPTVLGFKQDVLDGIGATPRASRRPLGCDLRDDWAPMLLDAGFDPALPTVWLAEGLLLYIPADGEGRLIETIDRLSAPGSALAFEIKRGTELPEVRESAIYTSTRHQIGVDLVGLFEMERKPDSAGHLLATGWSVDVTTPFDFTRRLGRGPLPEARDALASNRWVFGSRG